MTQKLPEIGRYLRQAEDAEMESITTEHGNRVLTQKLPEIGGYLRQAEDAEVESVTTEHGNRVLTQKLLEIGGYLRQAEDVEVESVTTGIDNDVLTHGESNGLVVARLSRKSAALKYAGRTVMRYPQEQMQEDARRRRRIDKSRELFEQQ